MSTTHLIRNADDPVSQLVADLRADVAEFPATVGHSAAFAQLLDTEGIAL